MRTQDERLRSGGGRSLVVLQGVLASLPRPTGGRGIGDLPWRGPILPLHDLGPPQGGGASWEVRKGIKERKDSGP